jgi:putative peptidoglycan lipid II flippase
MTDVVPDPATATAPKETGKSFVAHAKLISALTLVSRFFGLAREIAQANYFGTGMVAVAFRVAFAVPNLFRKLFGEGALSAAFIPLYVQATRNESPEQANRFAAASVTLLTILLTAITIIGEGVIFGLLAFGEDIRPDMVLTLKLSAIMLPYVLMICGTAFLGAILQVHKRFGAPAAAPVILNAVHIAVMVVGGRLLHLKGSGSTAELIERQTALAYWLSFFVLVAGVLQVVMLLPALKASGFRLRWVRSFWTPQVKKMLRMSLPVAMGAGVLQLSVIMDKGISALLAQSMDASGTVHAAFTLWGHTVRYPMEYGAAARLDLAQFLYQFPLGVFAIALATAIFPGLSADALGKDQARFKGVLRQGIETALFEGMAASAGLVIVAYPAIRLLFRHGALTEHDVPLIARSLAFYASAIWAFSVLQIINRAYYALHDTRTPFVMAVVNIVANLVVEIPLLWTPLGEAAMAVGTLVSFAVQAVVMLWMLDRRVGGIGLKAIAVDVGKMLVAVACMVAACWGVQRVPGYPHGAGKFVSAVQLGVLMGTGAVVYLGVSAGLGIRVMEHLMPRRFRRAGEKTGRG